MTVAEGSCTVTDTIYTDRFTHIAELERLGARINLDNNSEKNFQYKKVHLIESKNFKKNEIECFLMESNKYI